MKIRKTYGYKTKLNIWQFVGGKRSQVYSRKNWHPKPFIKKVIWFYELPKPIQIEALAKAEAIYKRIGLDDITERLERLKREKLINIVGDSEYELSIDKYKRYIF